jgi:hypothetical protein
MDGEAVHACPCLVYWFHQSQAQTTVSHLAGAAATNGGFAENLVLMIGDAYICGAL